MMSYKLLYIITFLSIVSFMSCEEAEVVMYSEAELNQKIDSLVVNYDTTTRLEFQQNYELRRHVEIKQRAEKIIENRLKKDGQEDRHAFTDTVRLRD